MDTTRMRTWAEIDLTALEHNYRTLRAMLPRECRFLGLCKANAYGHGAAVIGHTLERLGADMLAVACVSEAEELRQSGVKLPILCLGETPEELIPLLLELDVTQMVEDLETGRRLSAAAQRAGRTLRVHVKLDTGMSRLGFLWEAGREEETADEIARLCRLPGLEAEGLFTHFADADGSEAYTMAQFDRFLAARAALEERGIAFKICHCASSAAVLQYPCTYLDMVRPGLVLYGWYPAEELKGLDGPGLEPVMAVKSRVAAVRSLPKGTPVSYGRTDRGGAGGLWGRLSQKPVQPHGDAGARRGVPHRGPGVHGYVYAGCDRRPRRAGGGCGCGIRRAAAGAGRPAGGDHPL